MTRSSLVCSSSGISPTLVQKHGAAVGQLEPPDALRDGAGEGALLMPEHFAFQQAGGDGGAFRLTKVPWRRKLWS